MVSVIIPTHNRAHSIARAIDSALAQSYEDREVIVVDDGSTDGTDAVLRPYVSAGQITCVSLEGSSGGGAARNAGVRRARGTWLAFLDSDDEWHAEKLADQLELAEQLGARFVHCCFEKVGVDGRRRVSRVRPTVSRPGSYQLFRDHVNPTSTVMVRYDVFEMAGGFDESLPSRQDYDLWIRILEHADVYCLNKVRTTIHESRSSITTNVETRLAGHRMVLEKILRLEGLGRTQRRRIKAAHYFAMGRYLQKRGRARACISMFLASLAAWPLELRSLLGATVAALKLVGQQVGWERHEPTR